MRCTTLKIGETTAIVCSRPPRARMCRFCHERLATKLCDHVVARADLAPGGNIRTCDAPICEPCSISGGGNIDYCPLHAATHGLRALPPHPAEPRWPHRSHVDLVKAGYTLVHDRQLCRYPECAHPILIYLTPNKRKMPIDADTYRPHWVTCENAKAEQRQKFIERREAAAKQGNLF
jgi:hypothetical protein